MTKICTNPNCSRAGEHLPLAEFGIKKNGKFGLRETCRKCNVEYAKQYRLSHSNSRKRYQDFYNQSKKGKYNSYKGGARKRNISFELTEEQFFELIEKDCFYCARTVVDGKFHGVDRIINALGYEVNNCVPACFRCNEIKMDQSLEDTMEHVKRMLQVHEERLKVLDSV